MEKKVRKITAPNESDDPSKPIGESKGRWELFAKNIFGGQDIGDSYISAGYKVKSKDVASVCGKKLLKNAKIANRIAYLKKEAAAAMIADVTEVMRNMTMITRLSPFEVMANIKKYGMFVESVEFETKKVKDKETGEIKEKQVIKKIKLVSKAEMYKLIGRYYNMFTDTLRHEGKIEIESTISMKDFMENMKDE